MIKTSHIRRFLLMMAGAYALSFASVCPAADETHKIFPPLQLFKDFCLDAGWSLSDVSQLAAQRHLALMSSDDVPIPDGSPAHKNIWQAETVVGHIGVVVIEGTSAAHGHTFTCTVTAPPDSAAFIHTWCSSSFGDPTLTLNKPPKAIETHWTHSFEDGKVDVILLTQAPNENYALLTVMKHRDEPKGPTRNN
jgi:hypothetical protein